jgi:hypothetical protein
VTGPTVETVRRAPVSTSSATRPDTAQTREAAQPDEAARPDGPAQPDEAAAPSDPSTDPAAGSADAPDHDVLVAIRHAVAALRGAGGHSAPGGIDDDVLAGVAVESRALLESLVDVLHAIGRGADAAGAARRRDLDDLRQRLSRALTPTDDPGDPFGAPIAADILRSRS